MLGPSEEFLQRTSPNGKIGESKEFASVVSLLSYADFNAIFTGDSQISGLVDAVGDLGKQSLEILQIPHHGSKSGLNADIVQKLNPSMAIASVGKNRYGHPNKKIVQLFEKLQIPVLRTDKTGEIEIVSDGKKFTVNN